MKIAIIGDGYIGQAFKDIGEIIPFNRKGKTFTWDIRPYIENSDVIINTHELQEGSYEDLWYENVNVPRELSKHCKKHNRKFVQISTADLYGNHFKWDNDVETSTALDVGTDYRFTKLAAEKFCNPDNLIIRIRNPFDGRIHPDNAIIKGYMAEKMYSWADSWTYLPDMVRSVKTLLEGNYSGIYNVVAFECQSLFYCLKGVLKIPFFLALDPVKEDEPNFLMTVMDNVRIHNDVNGSKIKEICAPTALDVAMIVSWQTISPHFVEFFDEKKFQK